MWTRNQFTAQMWQFNYPNDFQIGAHLRFWYRCITPLYQTNTPSGRSTLNITIENHYVRVCDTIGKEINQGVCLNFPFGLSPKKILDEKTEKKYKCFFLRYLKFGRSKMMALYDSTGYENRDT